MYPSIVDIYAYHIMKGGRSFQIRSVCGNVTAKQLRSLSQLRSLQSEAATNSLTSSWRREAPLVPHKNAYNFLIHQWKVYHNQKTPLKAWKNKAKNVVTTSGHSIEVVKSSHKAKCVQQHISFNHTRDCLTWSSNTKTFLASHTIYSSYIYTSFNLLQNRKSTSTYFLLLPIWLWIL